MFKKFVILVGVFSCAVAGAATGIVEVDISDVAGKALASRVDLLGADGSTQMVPVPVGKLKIRVQAGDYTAYVYVYDAIVPFLVAVKPLHVVANDTAFLLVNLYEGAGGRLRLRDFDSDGDLVIDSTEMDAGTDPADAASYPGGEALAWDNQRLDDTARWYRGELHAHSKYGVGRESVAKLVKRAEKAGLDFLAIADRNTLDACRDKSFTSRKLVLIPAMEWGNDERGVALIYGPRTLPTPPATFDEAQALCLRVQAQGGVFAVAHPCLRERPWTWGLSYVNAVEVWYQDWRALPPLMLDQLDEDLKTRDQGRLVYSIAAAAATVNAAPKSVMGISLPDLSVSANRQALLFYEFEQARGLVASVLAGSGARDAKMPLARPVTYIYARELSLAGLLEGIRLGRTYVSSGLDGPELLFTADVLKNGIIDVTIGGIVPMDTDILFHVGVKNGRGKKVRLFRDGQPIATRTIDADPYMHAFEEHPIANSSYRVAVVSMPDELVNPKAGKRRRGSKGPGYGAQVFHAISGSIYSRDITKQLIEKIPNLDERNIFIRVPQDTAAGEVPLPPALVGMEDQ